MKRDFEKISEKLKESEAKLESVEQQVPIHLIRGPPLGALPRAPMEPLNYISQ